MENKIANPGPLGLCGFALTTFFLSCVNAGILKITDQGMVIGLAVFYGGIAQFAAGMWEFRTGNTFGATAFTSYGAFWLSFAAILIPTFGVNFLAVDAKTGAAAGPGLTAVGFYLLGWTIFTGLMMLGTFRINGGLVLVFVALFITFLLLALGFLNGQLPGSGLTQIGGYLGLVTAVLAWYVALAGILSAVSGGKWNLPVFPLGS